MTTDAGIQQIMGRYAPAAPGVGLDVDADLSVQIGGLLAEMRQERQRRAVFEQKMQQAIRSTPLLSVTQAAGTPATFLSPDWVCKTGYVWALQLVTAKGLGSSDVVWAYKIGGGGTAQELADQAARWPLTNAAPGWHPGRTGMIFNPGDGLAVQGTTTATVTINVEAIILEAWIAPDYLL